MYSGILGDIFQAKERQQEKKRLTAERERMRQEEEKRTEEIRRERAREREERRRQVSNSVGL